MGIGVDRTGCERGADPVGSAERESRRVDCCERDWPCLMRMASRHDHPEESRVVEMKLWWR